MKRLERGKENAGQCKDTLVIFFREPNNNLPWTVAAVVRMRGWNDLTLDAKTITYATPLGKLLEETKVNTGATKFDFVNLKEAVEISRGVLQREITHVMQQAKITLTSFTDVDFLPNGKIKIAVMSLPNTPLLGRGQ